MWRFFVVIMSFFSLPWDMLRNRMTTGRWSRAIVSNIAGGLERSIEGLLAVFSLLVQFNIALAVWFVVSKLF